MSQCVYLQLHPHAPCRRQTYQVCTSYGQVNKGREIVGIESPAVDNVCVAFAFVYSQVYDMLVSDLTVIHLREQHSIS